MRAIAWLVAIVCALSFFVPLVFAAPIVPVNRYIQEYALPVENNRLSYEFRYCVAVDVPTTCSVASITQQSLSGGSWITSNSMSLSPIATVPTTTYCWKVNQIGNTSVTSFRYKVNVSCNTSCGDAVCSGVERAGTIANTTAGPSYDPTVCLKDCGCSGGLAYGFNGFSYMCAQACAPYPTSGYDVQRCTASLPSGVLQNGGTAHSGGEVCQNQGETPIYCSRCGYGLYFDSTGNTCDQFVIGDSWCRYDRGEPLDYSVGGSISNPACGCVNNFQWDEWESCSCPDSLTYSTQSGCSGGGSCDVQACVSDAQCPGGYYCSNNCCEVQTGGGSCSTNFCDAGTECCSGMYCDFASGFEGTCQNIVET